MRCDEISERIVELLYDERGTPSGNPELRAHIGSCPACRAELADLQAVRSWLKAWKDEAPLRSLAFASPPVPVVPVRRRGFALRWARFAAVAAMLILAFLALANAEITWNSGGFAFRTRLFSQADHSDYYTKAEVRRIIKQVADESEDRMTETNRVMILRMLEQIEQEQQWVLSHISSRAARLRGKN